MCITDNKTTESFKSSANVIPSRKSGTPGMAPSDFEAVFTADASPRGTPCIPSVVSGMLDLGRKDETMTN